MDCKGDELCEVLEEQRNSRLQQENEVLNVSSAWAQGTWSAAWGPEGPDRLVPGSRRRRGRVRKRTELRDLRFDDPLTKQTVFRVVLPTLGALFGGVAIYGPCCLWLQDNLDIGNTGRGPILRPSDQVLWSRWLAQKARVGSSHPIPCGGNQGSLPILH